MNPHYLLNADFMFNKLLAFLLKSRIPDATPSEEQATPPFQEECKLSILWIIKIQLKNPSRGTLALVRLFVIIISALLLLFILRLNHLELKVTPAEKRAISQLVHTIAYIPRVRSTGEMPSKPGVAADRYQEHHRYYAFHLSAGCQLSGRGASIWQPSERQLLKYC